LKYGTYQKQTNDEKKKKKKKKKKETTTKFIFGLVTGHQWKNNKAVPGNNFPSAY